MVHAACNGHIKVPHAKPVHRLVNGGQGRGTGGIYGKVGAVQVKHVGHAARNDVGQFARHGVFGNRGEFFTHARVHFVQHFLRIGRRQGFKSRCVFEDFIQERAV